MFANIDKLLPDINGIGEIKNIDGFVLKAYEEKIPLVLFDKCPVGLPPGYYAQLEQYMLLFEKPVGRFIMNVDGNELKVVEVEADSVFQNYLSENAIDFGTRVEVGQKIVNNQSYTEEQKHQLLSEIEPQVTDQDTYNKFRTQQLLRFEQIRKERTMVGGALEYELAIEHNVLSGKIKEHTLERNIVDGKLKKIFFENSVDNIDLADLGRIGFRKRLSVAVHE